MKKAFTLIELLVAIGILAMVLSFASVIFRVSINSQRTASANAEIMRKLRAITDQLNADFQGLCKDGEIFAVWVAHAKYGADPTDPNSYERFDRIMFFADGDFQSYGVNHKIIQGNVARISYMLAKRGDFTNYTSPEVQPENQSPDKRILARTQHIYTDNNDLYDFLDPNEFPHNNDEWYEWNNRFEYDKTTLEQWKNISWDYKKYMLSVISNVRADSAVEYRFLMGATANPADPNSIHMLLCEGVGEFKIQGWSWDNIQGKWRWVPEVNPDGDGDLTDDTDFYLDGDIIDPCSVPGVLYPYGLVSLRTFSYDPNLLNETNFNLIPGLGRALKFTFTLYDSKGVIKDGRTFTYIVYLD